MSTDDAKSPSFVRLIGSPLMVAFCILLVPVLLLTSAYLEHVFIERTDLKRPCTSISCFTILKRSICPAELPCQSPTFVQRASHDPGVFHARKSAR